MKLAALAKAPSSIMVTVPGLPCPSPCQAVTARPPGTVHASTVGERSEQPGSGLLQCKADCTPFTTSPRYWHQAVSPAQDTLLAPLSWQFQGFPKHRLVCQPLTEVPSSLCYCTNSSLALQTLSATQPEVPPIHSSFTDKIWELSPLKKFPKSDGSPPLQEKNCKTVLQTQQSFLGCNFHGSGPPTVSCKDTHRSVHTRDTELSVNLERGY